MSLLDELKTECVMIDKRTVPDGYGGFTPVWVEGATFTAAIIKDTSSVARVAERDGLSEIYTAVVDKGIPLQFHDVFKRIGDNQIFRVTSNIVDSEAPARSSVQIGKVSLEKWVLPNA